MRGFFKPLAAALVMAASPALTQASPYSQFVIFGDSLSDSGQFPDVGGPLLGGNPLGGLRFTNRTGPTYEAGNGEYYDQVSTQLLASRLGLSALPSTPLLPALLTGNPDGTNYAVGGYRTDQILASIVDAGGSVVSAGPLSRSRNGYLVDMPRVDPDTLFYVNGGGNDIFQDRNVDPASAALVAGDLVAGVAALQAAGARYIMVSDLPDVGATPLGFASGARPLWTARTEWFNAALDEQLAALGGNVIRLNFNALLGEVQGDLATFGFDPTVVQTDYCFVADNCLEHPVYGVGGTAPDPSRLMFNDGVHPTAAVQDLSADYLYALLSAPWEVSLLPEMGFSSLRGHLRQLDNELALRRGDWQPVGGWSMSVQGGYRRPNFDAGGANPSGDGRSLTLDITASNRITEHWLAGISLGLGDNRLELGSDDSRYDMRSLLATGFARYERERLFAQISLSAGRLEYDDLKRTFALGIAQRSEKGDTEGWIWGAAARTGFNLFQPDERLAAGPFVGVDYQRVEVDGYAEKSGRSTAIAFDDQVERSLRLSAGLFLDYRIGDATRLTGEVARESERKDDARDLRMGLTSVPGNRFILAGYAPPSGQTRFGLGLAHALADNLSLRINYDYRGNDDYEQGVGVALSWDL